MNFVRLIFSPPQFENDPERTRQALLLHMAANVLFFAPISLILLNLILGSPAERAINVVLAGIALSQIPVRLLAQKGRIDIASGFLLLMSWVAMTWIASKVEGVGDVAVVCYFLILLGSGYLLGWRAVTLFTTWTILAIWVLAIYEWAGLLHPAPGNPIRIAIDLTIIFVIASLEIYFVISALTKSANDARKQLDERKRVEDILLEEQERLNLALSAAQMETWSWNIETGAISWSDGIEAMFGMAKGQFDGKYDTYLAHIHPDDLPGLQDAINHALLDTDFNYVVEHRLVQQNGEVRWIEGRGKVFRDAGGKPVRMAGTVVDVTERKRGEAEREHLIQELAAKNTELEQFTYTVSHDLKAPIITIKGFLGYLEEDALGGKQDRLRRDIVRISEAVDKMHLLLNELLELSRIGRMMNPPEPIEFCGLVDEALSLVQGRLQAGRVKVEVISDPIFVRGDRRRLLEVLQNLIDNAAKFMGPQPAPLVEIGSNGYKNDMPVFFVSDNGIGIAPEHHERIFGLFNKLDPLAEGTGIGLALVRRIVEYHGGTIWVKSEAGRGATFYFTLPAAEIRDNLPQTF